MKFSTLFYYLALSFFYFSIGLGSSLGQENIVIKLNKNYVKQKMDHASLTIIFSQGCGYCLLLNKFLIEEKVCEKYQISLNVFDVTYLDKGVKMNEAKVWNNYPDCSETKLLEEGKYKMAKLRPILFYKNRKGKTTKIMGFDKDKLISILEADLLKE